MTYELAKELKDARFPFGGLPGDFVNVHNGHEYFDYNDEYRSKNYIRLPTLSDLIEACGDEFGLLRSARNPDHTIFGWTAAKYEVNGPSLPGSTPEEAVARLWLALSKKV